MYKKPINKTVLALPAFAVITTLQTGTWMHADPKANPLPRTQLLCHILCGTHSNVCVCVCVCVLEIERERERERRSNGVYKKPMNKTVLALPALAVITTYIYFLGFVVKYSRNIIGKVANTCIFLHIYSYGCDLSKCTVTTLYAGREQVQTGHLYLSYGNSSVITAAKMRPNTYRQKDYYYMYIV